MQLLNKKSSKPSTFLLTESQKRRTLAACAVLTVGLGITYSWSILVTPISEYYECTIGQASIAYTINNILCPVSMVISGLLLRTQSERRMLRIASVLALLGFLLFGAWNNLSNLYICFGLMSGFGMSTVYGIVVTFGPKLFPEKSGLATGVIVTGLGIGMLVIPIIAQCLLQIISITTTMRILGVFFFVLVQACVVIMSDLPKTSFSSMQNGLVSDKDNNYYWAEIFTKPVFYILFLLMFTGATSGLLLVSNSAVIATVRFGMNTALATATVSVIAIANTIGRLTWGWLSDLLGRYRTLCINFLFSALMMITIAFIPDSIIPGFIAAAAGSGFAYGGFMSILPPMCSETLGSSDTTFKFGAVYVGFALGGFIGPLLPSWLNSSYVQPFFIIAFLELLGIGLVLLLKKILKEKSL